MSRIVARDAEPGFYMTPRGSVIEVVAPARVTGAWPTRDGVPYRKKANPSSTRTADQVAVYGYLPDDYLLKPWHKPRWWSTQDNARARRLKKRRRKFN